MRECRPPAREPARSWLGAPLDDGDVDARQRQLARQHQPRRTASGDHHRMLGHRTLRSESRRSPPAHHIARSSRTIRESETLSVEETRQLFELRHCDAFLDALVERISPP